MDLLSSIDNNSYTKGEIKWVDLVDRVPATSNPCCARDMATIDLSTITGVTDLSELCLNGHGKYLFSFHIALVQIESTKRFSLKRL